MKKLIVILLIILAALVFLVINTVNANNNGTQSLLEKIFNPILNSSSDSTDKNTVEEPILKPDSNNEVKENEVVTPNIGGENKTNQTTNTTGNTVDNNFVTTPQNTVDEQGVLKPLI